MSDKWMEEQVMEIPSLNQSEVLTKEVKADDFLGFALWDLKANEDIVSGWQWDAGPDLRIVIHR